MKASIHGGNGDSNRSKSVLNLRATIIFFVCIQIIAKNVLEILEIDPETTSYKLKTITQSHGGTMLDNFRRLLLGRNLFKIY